MFHGSFRLPRRRPAERPRDGVTVPRCGEPDDAPPPRGHLGAQHLAVRVAGRRQHDLPAQRHLRGEQRRPATHRRPVDRHGRRSPIHALGGDDVVCGGEGNDVVHGDDGADRLYRGSGDDTPYRDRRRPRDRRADRRDGFRRPDRRP
ncbi:hypothetical protein ABZU75_23525 [Streptosporangium sp. NPDC005286]|uniref:hypothetical protein n=1 Tax=Streptosporangium sp. NPDC005286 TaxID=3154463 RepID=UPI0033AF9680